MYAIAINGSPRKGGNTEILLKETIKPLEEAGWKTEFLQIGGKDLRGCTACYKCFEKQDFKCSGRKDGFNEILEKIFKADAVILGTPTYFTDVSAEMKALIDRTGLVAIANNRALAGKIGAAVVAVRRGGATHAFDSINHLFQMSQMIIPGSTYWNMGMGRDKGDVKGDEEGLVNMKNLGDTIKWLGESIKPHMESFPKV